MVSVLLPLASSTHFLCPHTALDRTLLMVNYALTFDSSTRSFDEGMPREFNVSLVFVDVESFDRRQLQYSYPLYDACAETKFFLKDGHLILHHHIGPGEYCPYAICQRKVLLQLSDVTVCVFFCCLYAVHVKYTPTC